MWATAGAYEQIVLLSMDVKSNERLDYHLKQASFYFISSENASNAVALYSKVSKYHETNKEIDLAIEAEKKAYELIIEFEVKPKRNETINHLISLYVEDKKIPEAIDVYKTALEGEETSNVDSVSKQNNSVCLRNLPPLLDIRRRNQC